MSAHRVRNVLRFTQSWYITVHIGNRIPPIADRSLPNEAEVGCGSTLSYNAFWADRSYCARLFALVADAANPRRS
jgi:hypothetical protein